LKCAGIEGAYTLDCFSDDTLKLEKVADVRQKKVFGEWRGFTAGGSHLNSTWSDNPQYFLYVPPPVSAKPSLRIVVTLDKGWEKVRKRDPLNCMLAVYLLHCPPAAISDGKEDNIFTPARRQHLSKEDYSYRLVDATFLPSSQTVVSLDNIKPSKNPYLIIPATYGRDKAGAFTLEVTSNVEIFLVECN